MKVTIDKNERYLDPEIIVKCKEVEGVIQDIVSYIGIANKNMIGEIAIAVFVLALLTNFINLSVFFFYTYGVCFDWRWRYCDFRCYWLDCRIHYRR